MTSQRQRLAYARVCIEVDKQTAFPSFIDIEDYNGMLFKQPVEYEWIPTICDGCKQFGHRINQCPKGVKQQWRPVAKPNHGAKLQNCQNEAPPESSNSKDPIKLENFNIDQTKFGVNLDELSHGEQGNSVGVKDLVVLHYEAEKIDCLVEQHEESPLTISPLAIQGPDSIQEAAPIHNLDAITKPRQGNNESKLETPKKAKEKKIDDQEGVDEDDNSGFQLTRSQRKKKAKMMHALMHKNKASQAKSNAPPPSSSK